VNLAFTDGVQLFFLQLFATITLQPAPISEQLFAAAGPAVTTDSQLSAAKTPSTNLIVAPSFSNVASNSSATADGSHH
jgi:hypothetical protein